MNRFLINMLAFMLSIPLYVLVLFAWLYVRITTPIFFRLGETEQEPYKWFDVVDLQMCKLYKEICK